MEILTMKMNQGKSLKLYEFRKCGFISFVKTFDFAIFSTKETFYGGINEEEATRYLKIFMDLLLKLHLHFNFQM